MMMFHAFHDIAIISPSLFTALPPLRLSYTLFSRRFATRAISPSASICYNAASRHFIRRRLSLLAMLLHYVTLI